jgi:hypothetical protein
MRKRQQQQGDVTVEYVTAIPAGGRTVPPSARGFVIAEGEHTGHAHVLDAEGVLEMREVDGVLYARIASPVALSHEEHHTQTIEPGIVRFGRVQEYDHFAEEARTVAD